MSNTCNAAPLPIPLDRDAAPRLLVSVRDASEARAAIDGGADIIDIKDPDQGSLGRASNERMVEVSREITSQSSQSILSAALGEAIDFDSGLNVQLPDGVSLAKMGLSQLASRSDWTSCWSAAMGSVDAQRGSPLKWVAVAYADEETAQSPRWQEILDYALTNPAIGGMLFDTWSKSSGALLDHRSAEDLAYAARRLHATNRFLAVAGRLKTSDLLQFERSDFDVFAVRSAACVNFDRRRTVQSSLVQRLKADLATSLRAS